MAVAAERGRAHRAPDDRAGRGPTPQDMVPRAIRSPESGRSAAVFGRSGRRKPSPAVRRAGRSAGHGWFMIAVTSRRACGQGSGANTGPRSARRSALARRNKDRRACPRLQDVGSRHRRRRLGRAARREAHGSARSSPPDGRWRTGRSGGCGGTLGQHMEQEAAHELPGRQAHDLRLRAAAAAR